jgi:hypothetical protein
MKQLIILLCLVILFAPPLKKRCIELQTYPTITRCYKVDRGERDNSDYRMRHIPHWQL